VSARRFGEGASDVALSQKLGQELQYEKEAASGKDEPEFLKEFKAEDVWQIEDVDGNDEVTLTRKFGNESIRLMFSIADIQSGDEEPQFNEAEEEADDQPGDDSDEVLHAFPIRASFSITKASGPGALTIDTVCQDGAFVVENMSFYRDARLGTELTAEADWKRRGLYIGPQFETLDVTVQEEFEKFLRERGIDERLALFVPEYAEHKEQKEYVKWLANVQNFIDF
jgi:complement component 1 Q subcomponent-binding protein